MIKKEIPRKKEEALALSKALSSPSTPPPLLLRGQSFKYPPEAIAYLSHGKTHYRLQGNPTGELVVLVHGFGLLYSMWDKMCDALILNGYQTLCYDLYGMGWSDSPRKTSHNIQLLTTQITELLEWIGVPEDQKLHFIGFSQGGCVSASFAKQHPHRIRSLILIAPAGLSPYRFAWTTPLVLGGTILAYVVDSRPVGSITRRLMQVLSTFVAKACKIEMPPTEEEARSLLARRLELSGSSIDIQELASKQLTTGGADWDFATVLYDLGQMARQMYLGLKSELFFCATSHLSVHGRLCTLRDFPFFQDLSEDIYRHVGRCVDRTLVVWGTKDRMLRYKEGLKDHIKSILPKAQVEVFQGVGHSLIVEKCHFLQSLLLRFLNHDVEFPRPPPSISAPNLSTKEESYDEESDRLRLRVLSEPSFPCVSNVEDDSLLSIPERQTVDDHEDGLIMTCMKTSSTPGIAFPPSQLISSSSFSKTGAGSLSKSKGDTAFEEVVVMLDPMTATPHSVILDDLLPLAVRTAKATTTIAFSAATLPARLVFAPVRMSGWFLSGLVTRAADRKSVV